MVMVGGWSVYFFETLRNIWRVIYTYVGFNNLTQLPVPDMFVPSVLKRPFSQDNQVKCCCTEFWKLSVQFYEPLMANNEKNRNTRIGSLFFPSWSEPTGRVCHTLRFVALGHVALMGGMMSPRGTQAYLHFYTTDSDKPWHFFFKSNSVFTWLQWLTCPQGGSKAGYQKGFSSVSTSYSHHWWKHTRGTFAYLSLFKQPVSYSAI